MNRWTLLVLILLSGGCATDSSKSIAYYHFDIDKTSGISHASFDKPRLEIKPMVMPDHLNSRGIAQRLNKHRTVNANWHLWASQPGDMLDRTALNQLETSMPKWLVVSAEEPWLIQNSDSQDKIVRLQFSLERFNGGLDNNAEIIGSWTLFDHGNQLLMRQNFNQSVKLESDGYEGLTAALQLGWEKICRQVADEIRASTI